MKVNNKVFIDVVNSRKPGGLAAARQVRLLPELNSNKIRLYMYKCTLVQYSPLQN
jgi:hypothetical protein